MSNFEQWNGEYEKVYYDIKVGDEIIEKCWPNAGKMNASDGSGRSWKKDDNISIRETQFPWFKEGYEKPLM